MKAGILLLSLTFTLLLAGCKKKNTLDPAAGPDQSSFASAPAINQRLGRGINLGDTYEASWAEKQLIPPIFNGLPLAGSSMYACPSAGKWRHEVCTRHHITYSQLFSCL